MISVLSAAIDASVSQAFTTRNYASAGQLGLSGGGTVRRAFIFFTRPFPLGATVTQAILKLVVRSGFSGGPHTLSIQRVSTSWKENIITYANPPSVAGSVLTFNVGSSLAAGTVLDLDITSIMQDVAAGAAYYGLRISIDTSVVSAVYSSEATESDLHPQLTVTWSSIPSEPTDMRPAGGRVVSLAHPTLAWRYNDADGDEQAAYRVEVANDAAFTSSFEDSGWVSSNLQEYAVVGSLVDGNTYYWRVTTKDSSGGQSPVSDIQQFGRDAKGSLSITNPTNGGTVPETTPPIVHSLSGETQTGFQQLLYEQLAGETDFDLIYDSGVLDGASTSLTLPAGLITSDTSTYRIVVRVWDAKDREATPGDARYVEAQADFTYVRDDTPAPPTSLALTFDGSPAFVLTFQRSSTPDYFALKVDGAYVDDRIDPESIRVDATHYLLRAWELRPWAQHTLEVEAVVDNAGVLQHSGPNPTVVGTAQPVDAWFVMPTKNLYVRIATESSVDYEIGEDGETFFPINRRDPVRIVGAIRGFEGTISGKLGVQPNQADGEVNRQGLEDIKSWHRRGERVLLIHGKRQFPVLLGTVSTVPEAGSNNKWFIASVQFWQAGAPWGIRDR